MSGPGYDEDNGKHPGDEEADVLAAPRWPCTVRDTQSVVAPKQRFFCHFNTSSISSSATGTDQSDPSFAISPIRLGKANRIFPDLPFLSDRIASNIRSAEHSRGSLVGRSAIFSASSILA